MVVNRIEAMKTRCCNTSEASNCEWL